jgi:hypothetical protein
VQGSEVGRGEGRQLGVGEARLDGYGISRRHDTQFGEAAIVLAAEVGCADRRVRHARRKDRVDQHLFADARRGHPLTHGDDLAGYVGALDAREAERLAPPALRGLRVVFGAVPALACPDVGVVDRRRADPYQDLVRARLGVRPVLVPFDGLRAAVARQDLRVHLCPFMLRSDPASGTAGELDTGPAWCGSAHNSTRSSRWMISSRPR